MYKTIYPISDATIYSQFPSKNTGVDQILTISKQTLGSATLENSNDVTYNSTYNSRILIKFDLTDISSSVASNKINAATAQYFLTLRSTEAKNLPFAYDLYAYPVSGGWDNGRGFFNNNPEISTGVSWKYRTSKLVGDLWSTSSYNANSTGSFTVGGGSNWYTSSVASQSFNHTEPDVRMDVTGIVGKWISGSIANNGFVLKLSDTLEQNLVEFGKIDFFSRETHTIFVPRLEIYWDDYDSSGNSSVTEIESDQFVLYCKNLRESYSDSEKPKIRFGVRNLYPEFQYASPYATTGSAYLNSKRLPLSSYFQIQDTVTDEVIIPFNVIGTKINCDSLGNYIKLDCNSLMSERYYKIVVKSEFEDGDVVRIIDDGHIFKIVRH